MPLKQKILWAVVIVLVVIGVFSVMVTRYAAFLSMKQGPQITRYSAAPMIYSQDGVAVKARLLNGNEPGQDLLLLTTFLIFEVEIDNQGKNWVDFDYYKFSTKDDEGRVRPLSRDEVSREISSRFFGNSLSPQGTNRQLILIQEADKGMVDSARIFPGFSRKGWILFTMPQDIPDPVTLRLQGLQTPNRTIGPMEFSFPSRPS